MATVLLAEASRDLRETYHQYLARHGFQVETVESGLECVSKLRQFVPDLLILDLELPWGGGDGVLAMMREHPRLTSVPVLLTSAVAFPERLGGLVSSPIVKALAKPFPLSALLEHAANAASVRSEPLSDDTDRPVVLVVDDEPVVRDVLRKYLEQQGFHVWTAENGDHALDLCCEQGEHVAIVLLDVQMPILDGPHTLEGLQAFNPDLPVCFMTGDPIRYEPADLLRQGARHVLVKPLHLDEVGRIVRRLTSELRGDCKGIDNQEMPGS